MTAPEPKYRPVLSATQIETILELCKTMPVTAEKMQVIATLSPFMAKIQNAGITAAYIMAPKESLEQKLGFTSLTDLNLSPSEKRRAAYNKYQLQKINCSVDEIQLAQTYMFENNLMSPEEIRVFTLGMNNLGDGK